MKKLIAIMLALSLLGSLFIAFGTVSADTSDHELLDFTVMEDLSISARSSREMWGLALTHIINGNYSSYTECYRSMGESSDSNIDEWIVLDLGEVHNIDKYGFATHITASAEGMPRAFTISVSHTGKEWTQVYSENSLAPATGTLIYEFEFEETEARFIKLHVTELAGPIGASTYEVQLRELFVYGTSIEHESFDFTSMDDVAVSAKTSLEQWGHGVEYLIDGDSSTISHMYISQSDSSDVYLDEWILLDLGNIYNISQYGFASFTPGSPEGLPKEFAILVSETGEDGTWTEVFSEDSLEPATDKLVYTFAFSTIQARYIRMDVTEIAAPHNTSYNIRLRELYVYGDTDPVIPEATPTPDPTPTTTPDPTPTPTPDPTPTPTPDPTPTPTPDPTPTPTPEPTPEPPEFDEPDEYHWFDFAQRPFTSVEVKTDYDNPDLNKGYLIDGDSTTSYMTKGGYDDVDIDEWILLDLGNDYAVRRFGFEGFANANYVGLPTEFTVSVSETGEEGSWIEVLDVKGITLTADNRIYEFSFSPVKARYIRMDITKIGGPIGGLHEARMRQLMVFGVIYSDGIIDDDDEVDEYEEPDEYHWFDFAERTLPSIEVKTDYANIDLSKEYLIDGNSDTSYMTKGGYTDNDVDEWIILDLGKDYAISRFGFEAFANANSMGLPTEFTVSVSETGEEGSWSEVLNVSSVNLVTDRRVYTFSFTPVKARYIRMDITKIGGPIGGLYEARMRQLMVYGVIFSEDALDYGEDETPEVFIEPEEFHWFDFGARDLPSVTTKSDYGTGDLNKNHLIDGNPDTSFMTQGGYDTNFIDEWIILDLGRFYMLSRFGFEGFAMGGHDGLPTAFKISISETGADGTWTDVYLTQSLQTTADNRIYTFSFDPVRGRYIRMEISQIGGPVGGLHEARLRRLMVYGLLYDFYATDTPDYPDTQPGDENKLLTFLLISVLSVAVVLFTAILNKKGKVSDKSY